MSMHPPPDPDELASDLVDGLLPADQAARLHSDPAIAARVRAIEAARAALRVPPSSSPGAVDRAVAAAFAAVDDATLPLPLAGGRPPAPAADSGERPPPPVTHLPAGSGSGGYRPAHSPGASRPSRPGSGMPWLAAAAAIVVIGLITIGLVSGRSTSDSDSSTAEDVAASAAPEGSDGDDSSGAGGSAADGGEGETMESAEEGATASPPGDEGASHDQSIVDDEAAPTTSAQTETTPRIESELGAVDTPAELADRIRARRTQGGPDATTSMGPSNGLDTGGGSECAGLTAAGDPQRGEVVYVADAVYAGEPVRVHLYDTGDGNLRLVATDRSCTDVVDTPYAG